MMMTVMIIAISEKQETTAIRLTAMTMRNGQTREEQKHAIRLTITATGRQTKDAMMIVTAIAIMLC